MRSALGGVTQGLSVAFNTTFLALVGVIPVMVLSSMLRKGEEDLLLSIEEYCLEDLLPNLHVRQGEEAMDEVVHEHLGKLVEFSENWRRQVAPVMNELEQHSESLKHQVIGLQPLLQHYSDKVFVIKDHVQKMQAETADQSAVSKKDSHDEIAGAGNQNASDLANASVSRDDENSFATSGSVVNDTPEPPQSCQKGSSVDSGNLSDQEIKPDGKKENPPAASVGDIRQ